MHIRAIQHIIGVLLMLFSLTMLPPVLVAWIYDEVMLHVFFVGFLVTFVTGLVLWLMVKGQNRELQLRDGFMVVVLFWVVLGLFGAIPFLLATDLSIVDSVFESLSGLTTTGATVITGLDHLPRALLYYRQQLQWLGGMGIIVLSVVIFAR